MAFTLNPEQKHAVAEVVKFVSKTGAIGDEDRFVTLRGPAGSGKTTTIVEMIRSLPRHIRICLSCTTNKGVKVIRRMLQSHGLENRVDARTIHSVLALKMKPFRGDEVLSRDEFAKEDVYDFLVIDEGSMLNDEMILYILESKSKFILFSGDKYQIGPINTIMKGADGYQPTNPDGESRIFTDVDTHLRLNTHMRQKQDEGRNPIIELSNKLRILQDAISYNLMSPFSMQFPAIVDDMVQTKDGIVGIYRMLLSDWIRKAAEIFGAEEFINNPDTARCVCYTNVAVNQVNDWVRKELHGTNVAEYIVGEYIVAQDMGQTWRNSDEFRIIALTDDYDEENQVGYWIMRLESLDDATQHDAKVVKREYHEAFQFRLNAVAEKANTDKMNSSMYWKSFWAIKKSYNEFKYIYAMTAHKSQGSTFKHTFINFPDFAKSGVSMEVLRLLYTSETRSTNLVVFGMGQECYDEMDRLKVFEEQGALWDSLQKQITLKEQQNGLARLS